MCTSILPYDPGVIPTRPAPLADERLTIKIQGLPPYKDLKFSIRNSKHPQHNSFKLLRQAAILQMDGRAWSFGPIELNLTIFSPQMFNRHTLNEYMGGIMDTLDGSAGTTFTFLPIAFQDDCQVVKGQTKWVQAQEIHYVVEIMFLADEAS